MSWYDNSPRDHVVWAHLVKHSPSFLHASSGSIWHTCQQGYSPQRHLTHITWMICSWANLPSSSAHKLVHALSTWTKVKLWGHSPSCCFSQVAQPWHISWSLCSMQKRPQYDKQKRYSASHKSHQQQEYLFTFFDLWSHHCEGSEKNSCQSFSLCPPQTMETAKMHKNHKNQSCTSHKATTTFESTQHNTMTFHPIQAFSLKCFNNWKEHFAANSLPSSAHYNLHCFRCQSFL
jgi:hypothetical protein